MVILFAVLAVILLLVGSGVAFYSSGKRADKRKNEIPKLTNKSFRKKVQYEQKLFEWAATRDAELGNWLQGLSAERRKQLLKEITTYCKPKNFELAWLLEHQIEDSELQDEWALAVTQYLQSQRTIHQAQEDLENYVALVDLLQNASRHSHREKLQAVYAQLVNQNIIASGNVDMMLSKDRSRWQKAAKAIAEASRTHRRHVNSAVREHMLGIAPRTIEMPENPAVPTALSSSPA